MPSVISLNTTTSTELINNTLLNNKVVPAAELRAFVQSASFGGLLSTAGTGSIPAGAIQPIGTTKILDSAITTAKIADLNVTETKLAASSVATGKIANNAVTSDKLANNAVTSAKIADSSVTTTKIADSAITNTKIANSTIAIGKLNTTGTANNTTYLRGDGVWATVSQAPNVAAGTGITVTIDPNTNTASIAHASHTGDVTGSTTLTITNGAVTSNKIENGAVGPSKLSTGAPTWTTGGALSISNSASIALSLSVGGNITTQNRVKPTSWTGGVTTFDVYSDGGSIGIGSAGTGVLNAYISNDGNITINNSSPNIFLQDNNGRTATIHVNNDNFYVLRGAVNQRGWDSGPSGRHPMTLNLENGNVVFSGNVTAFSDLRLKTNVKTIENALSKTLNMRGVTFERDDSKDRCIGVVAQEVREVLPEAVIEDNDGYLSVSYGNMVGVLIEAIKELNKKVEILENNLNK